MQCFKLVASNRHHNVANADLGTGNTNTTFTPGWLLSQLYKKLAQSPMQYALRFSNFRWTTKYSIVGQSYAIPVNADLSYGNKDPIKTLSSSESAGRTDGNRALIDWRRHTDKFSDFCMYPGLDELIE
jgi:hypothetical protein